MMSQAPKSPKTIKQGIRSRLAGHTKHHQLERQQGPQEKGEAASLEFQAPTTMEENAELGVEDYATIPRVVGNGGGDEGGEDPEYDPEDSLHLLDATASIHKPPNSSSRRPLVCQDSPRGPEEFGQGSLPTTTTAIASSQGWGSSEFHSSMPLSPTAVPVVAASHPHSAPVESAATPTSGGRNFLKKKLKLKTTSTHRRKHKHHAAVPDFKLPFEDVAADEPTQRTRTSHASAVTFTGTAEDPNTTATSNSNSNPPAEDHPGTKGAGADTTKGAGKGKRNPFRMSFSGLKSLATGGRNALNSLIHMDHDDEEQQKEAGPSQKVPDEDGDEERLSKSGPGIRRTFTDEIALGVSKHLDETETVQARQEEAKRRRREKHHQRLLKQGSRHTHATTSAADNDNVVTDSPRNKRSSKQRRQKKLDREARERLKKHSAENEYRRKHANRERRKQVLAASKHESFHNMNDSSKRSLTDDDEDEDYVVGEDNNEEEAAPGGGLQKEQQEEQEKQTGAKNSNTEGEGVMVVPSHAVRVTDAKNSNNEEAVVVAPVRAVRATSTGAELPRRKKRGQEENENEVNNINSKSTRASTSGITEPQIRKQKKKEDEKLRERVRKSIHQNSINADIPFQIRDLLDEEKEENESDDEGYSFAEEALPAEAATNTTTTREDANTETIRNVRQDSSTSMTLDSLHGSSGHPSSSHGSSSFLQGSTDLKNSNTSSTSLTLESLQASSTLPSSSHGSSVVQRSSAGSNQLSYQSVVSNRSERYLQLVIDSVPSKAPSPPESPSAKRKTVGGSKSNVKDPSKSSRRSKKEGHSRPRTDGPKGSERRRRRSAERPSKSNRQSQKARGLSEPRRSSSARKQSSIAVDVNVEGAANHQSAPVLVSSNHMGNESCTKLDFAADQGEVSKDNLERSFKRSTSRYLAYEKFIVKDEKPITGLSSDPKEKQEEVVETKGTAESAVRTTDIAESLEILKDSFHFDKRHPNKVAKEDNAEQEQSMSEHSTRKKEHRSNSDRLGRTQQPEKVVVDDGDDKKKKKSSRGREGKRTDSSGTRRRHSLDAELRKKAGKERAKANHKKDTVQQELGMSLQNFNW